MHCRKKRVSFQVLAYTKTYYFVITKGYKNYAFDDWQQTIPTIRKLLRKDVVVLVKGSRGMKLDKLVDNLSQ